MQSNYLQILILLSLILPKIDYSYSRSWEDHLSCQRLLFISETPRILKHIPFDQWREWEQLYNAPEFRKTSTSIKLEYTDIDPSDLNIYQFDSKVSMPFFLKSAYPQKIHWFFHPHNTSTQIPFQNLPKLGNIPVYYQASRSLTYFSNSESIYSIKLGTNRPHLPYGPYDGFERLKISTKMDLHQAITRMKLINSIDQASKPDPYLILAKEIFAIEDKNTGEAYLVRDLNFLKNPNYYLPGFSIPYLAGIIAKINKQSVQQFWGNAYAQALGRAKARLLIRYGLQFETPHPQNILIEFDSKMRPTGRIVFRDLSDTKMITPVVKALGFDDLLSEDLNRGIVADNQIEALWRYSSNQFLSKSIIDDLTYNNEISFQTVTDWKVIHDEAFKKEIREAYGLSSDVDFSIDREVLFTNKPESQNKKKPNLIQILNDSNFKKNVKN